MKKICSFISLMLVLNGAVAQLDADKFDNEPVIVISTYTLPAKAIQDSISNMMPIDSILHYYVQHGIKPNPMIRQFRVMQHVYGADSYKVIFFKQIDKFSNLNKAEFKTFNLLINSFKDNAELKKFAYCFNTLFDRHEDNIVADWVDPVFQ